MIEMDHLRYGGAYPPVKTLLGKRTFKIVSKPERVESWIVFADPMAQIHGLTDCIILAPGPALSGDQIETLREAILTPESYFTGWPKFRRFPSVPNFALRIWRNKDYVDLLLDLTNPGWEFHCGAERYSWFHWVGTTMQRLAKELFPKFASPSSRSMWKQGAIKKLKDAAIKR